VRHVRACDVTLVIPGSGPSVTLAPAQLRDGLVITLTRLGVL
jgi:hypothetical protein